VNGSELGEDFVDPTVNIVITEASVKSNAAEKGLKRGIMLRFKGGGKGLKDGQVGAMKDGGFKRAKVIIDARKDSSEIMNVMNVNGLQAGGNFEDP
jgi:hypothetical protein